MDDFQKPLFEDVCVSAVCKRCHYRWCGTQFVTET